MASDYVETSFISLANFWVENKREARKAVIRVPAAIRQWRKEQVGYFQAQTPHSNVRQMSRNSKVFEMPTYFRGDS